MDLSIIVPIHNLENCITPLLDSINAQKFYPYQVQLVFVFDDCTDKTEEIVNNYKFNDVYTDIEKIQVKVHSCGLARNTGFEYATGRYIWFADGDDWFLTNHAFYKVIETMEFTGAEVIRFDYESTFPYHDLRMMVWQYAYAYSFIKDLKFLNVQPHEDVLFNNQVYAKLEGSIPLFVDEKLYYYNYMRQGSNMWQYENFKKIEP